MSEIKYRYEGLPWVRIGAQYQLRPDHLSDRLVSETHEMLVEGGSLIRFQDYDEPSCFGLVFVPREKDK